MTKTKYLFTLLFCLLFFVFGYGEKHALIIAIGDYPEDGGWPDISSKNDIPHIKNALHILGFSQGNILTIVDEDATRHGILSQFKTLTKRVKKGDIVYIHFSGHGQQVIDDNGDEIDQLDESIVPYDSPLKFKAGIYEGERLIRDDLIGELTTQIRKKCGKEGQLVLILDSCHSGTGVRGMGRARGSAYIMAPEHFVKLKTKENKIGIAAAQSKNLAPMASYFGASARELNYETLDHQSNPVGSLSYAMSTTLSTMNKTYTFEELFDRVKLKMKALAPRQNPQWEGPSNVAVLSGTVVDQNHSYNVLKIKDSQNIEAELGTITGIYEGTTVELFSKGDQLKVASGEVTEAFLTRSNIRLDETQVELNAQLYEVKIKDIAFPSLQVTMKNEISDQSKWQKVAKKIYTSSMIKPAHQNADLYLSECGDDHAIQLATKDGSILLIEAYDPLKLSDKVKNIETVIRHFLQGKFLRSYENTDAKFDFSLQLVQVDCGSEKEIYQYNSQEQLDLKIGTCVRFKIKNNGIKGAYYSLIDIQPDNKINLLIPATDLGYTAEEYYLKAGESYTTDYSIQIYAPAGEEALKLIVSKTPQDLSGIISTQGHSKRGIHSLDPFEQALTLSYKDVGIRGVNIRSSQKDQVGTTTLFFNIVE